MIPARDFKIIHASNTTDYDTSLCQQRHLMHDQIITKTETEMQRFESLEMLEHVFTEAPETSPELPWNRTMPATACGLALAKNRSFTL